MVIFMICVEIIVTSFYYIANDKLFINCINKIIFPYYFSQSIYNSKYSKSFHFLSLNIANQISEII